MFGLGFTEIIFLGLLGLILIKPEDLPHVARSLGRFLNELKRSTENIRSELSSKPAKLASVSEIRQGKFDSYKRTSTESLPYSSAPSESITPSGSVESVANSKSMKIELEVADAPGVPIDKSPRESHTSSPSPSTADKPPAHLSHDLTVDRHGEPRWAQAHQKELQ